MQTDLEPNAKVQATWYQELLKRAFQETDDISEAIMSADIALAIHPLPTPKEEPKPTPPISATFSFDIYNERAQGILNRAVKASKKLSDKARRDFKKALEAPTPEDAVNQIVHFLEKYRMQLADVLSATQLASILSGAREVARQLPTIPRSGVVSVALPPSLNPKKAAEIIEGLQSLSDEEREKRIIALPLEHQTYIRQSLFLEDALPPPPPVFRVAAPAAGDPERIVFPIIEEAVRELAEKNVVTRDVYDRLDNAARAKAFTIAGVDSQETLEKVRDVMAENMAKGVDWEDFRDKMLEQVEPGTFLSDGHMENVFRTNIQAQFTDGQLNLLRHPFVQSGYPYASYNAIHDDRTRHTHLALEKLGIDGTNMYRITDPVFQTFIPPWEWNDRCSWIAMSVDMAASKGLKEAQKWLETGVEPTPPAFVKMPDFRPPAGFVRPQMPLSIQLSMMPLDEWDRMRRKSAIFQATTDITPPATGAGPMAAVGDYTPEGKAKAGKTGKTGKTKGGKGRGRQKLTRKLRSSLRTPKKWKKQMVPASLAMAVAESVPGSEQLYVYHDWDNLKVMMVGRIDHDCQPDDPDDDDADADPMLNEGAEGKPGQWLYEVNPEKFKGAVKQLDNLCEVLEKEGVKVIRGPLIPKEIAKQSPVGLSAVNVRETFGVIGNQLFYGRMQAPWRNKEVAFTKELLGKEGPIPISEWLEFGDVFRLGNDLIITSSGQASTESGSTWLGQRVTKSIHFARLKPEWLHGDYVLATPREGCALVHRPAFISLPKPIKDWDIIDVTLEEAQKFACNSFALRPGVLVISEGNGRLVTKLEKRGCTAVEVPFDDVQFWDGGLDCSTAELFRE